MPIDSSKQITPKLVVGIGASAGGLEALEQFFENVPIGNGCSFVVVQHLSPDHESRMEELLQRRARIRVTTATNGMALEPDAIYLLPPGKKISVMEGVLLLEDRPLEGVLSLPVNHFFESLAENHGAKAVGVILSGSGSDGAKGVLKIHDQGGLVLVQSPDTAKFDGMPNSAIDTEVVDQIFAPEDLWLPISRFSRGEERSVLRDEQARSEIQDQSLSQVFELLRFEHEIDFRLYKSATVKRRLQRRMEVLDLSLDQYVELLDSDKEELQTLYNDLLIGVTEFLRDPEAFRLLQERVIIPIIKAHRESGDEIRVWVAGCATGEEAYTLAILFDQAFEGDVLPLKIIASDIHRISLEDAGRGVYHDAALKNLTDREVLSSFDKVSNGYRIIDRLRSSVVFVHHDIVNSAPFTHLDLVTCRNMLIYLRPPAQMKALSLIHSGLNKGGYFFSGPSESLGELSSEFEAIDPPSKIYQKRRDVRLISTGRLGAFSPVKPKTMMPDKQLGDSQNELSHRDLFALYDQVLEEFIPPGFLVNREGRIVHSFAGMESFSIVPSGRPSHHFAESLIPELRSIVSSAFFRCSTELVSIDLKSISVKSGDETRNFHVSIDPHQLARVNTDFFLIQIREVESDFEKLSDQSDPHHSTGFSDEESERRSRQISNLQRELNQTRESLQTTVEELETANEELQTTNEELQTANEELVASNEELQSTNEELHSVNEEIHTVNAEYRRKIDELSEITADLETLFENTDVGVVFLDTDLRIRRFTPVIADLFQLMPSDEGRFLSNFSHQLIDSNFLEEAGDVLNGGKIVEREIDDRSGKHYLLRILPFQIEGRILGVVITLVDLTSIRSAEQRIFKLARVVEEARIAIVEVSSEGVVESWNPYAEKILGYEASEAIGQDIRVLISPKGLEGEFQRHWSDTGSGAHTIDAVRRRKNGEEFDARVTLSRMKKDDDSVGVVAFLTDATEQKRTERQLRIKEAVAFILSESPPYQVAIDQILAAIVEQFPRQVAAEYWERSLAHPDQFQLRCANRPFGSECEPNANGESPIILQQQGALAGLSELDEAISLTATAELMTALSQENDSGHPVESVLIFPALHMHYSEGVFAIFTQRFDLGETLLSIAPVIGRMIGQYLFSLRMNTAALHAANRFVIAQYDEEGRYESVSNSHIDFPPEALIGKTDTEILPGEQSEEAMRLKLSSMMHDRVESMPYSLQTSTGSVDWQITFYPNNGTKPGGISIAVDHSALMA